MTSQDDAGLVRVSAPRDAVAGLTHLFDIAGEAWTFWYLDQCFRELEAVGYVDAEDLTEAQLDALEDAIKRCVRERIHEAPPLAPGTYPPE